VRLEECRGQMLTTTRDSSPGIRSSASPRERERADIKSQLSFSRVYTVATLRAVPNDAARPRRIHMRRFRSRRELHTILDAWHIETRVLRSADEVLKGR
jgi:hypothetical protein